MYQQILAQEHDLVTCGFSWEDIQGMPPGERIWHIQRANQKHKEQQAAEEERTKSLSSMPTPHHAPRKWTPTFRSYR